MFTKLDGVSLVLALPDQIAEVLVVSPHGALHPAVIHTLPLSSGPLQVHL